MLGDIHAEISAVEGYWGSEPQEDFSGPYVQSFEEDEDGFFDEDIVWKAILPWIESLSA